AFDIKRELERTHYKRATVRVSVSSIAYTNTGTITVQGYVKTPGLQQLLPGEIYTVTMAIAKAGGGTDFANLKKVQLTRIIDGEPKNFYINVKDVQEKGKLDLDMDVKAGDLIYVPQSYFR
ncbi:MAG: SLBB domain-containing protein, partial [Verrucomicrobia bacterium]|nr:SLBB domain-containing protein [Verrucomicrobiota bacterium]